MEMVISLDQMHFYAFHGVLQQEKKVGNIFVVDLSVGVQAYQALIDDSLDKTIDYSLIYECVKSEMDVPSDLLESLVGRIVRILFDKFQLISSLNIKLTKLNPPFFADIRGAGVAITITREEYNSVFLLK